MLQTLIKINGIYDIVCAICILYFPDTLPARLHLDSFKNMTDELHKRLLGYWILSYGIIRTFSSEKTILCTTYLIESFVYLQEYVYCAVITERSIFVSISSILIACVIYTPLKI